MNFEKAAINDIEELVNLRIAYLNEDYSGLSGDNEQRIKAALPKYYVKHLNRDLFVYVAREDIIVSCAFLLIIEKPANPAFITGKTGTLLNAYTAPDYRRKGLAKTLLQNLLQDAKQMELDFIELKATQEGYCLYRDLGFEQEFSKYKSMKYIFKG